MTTVARLLIREDNGAERVVDLPQGVVRIGRSLDNEVVLADADKGVSRAHAELHLQNGRYFIVDLQSQNGTWLNGLRVQRAEVRPDAEISIGTYRLRLQFAAVAPAALDRSGTGPLAAGSATVIGVKPSSRAATTAGTNPSTAVADMPLSQATVPLPYITPSRRRDDVQPAPAAAPPAASSSKTGLIIGGLAAVAVIGIVVGRFILPSNDAAPSTPGTVPAEAASPRPDPVPVTPVPSEPAPSATPAAHPPPPPVTGTRPSGRSAAVAEATRTAAGELPVTRKPGESLPEWRERSAALQARYAYSKVALDRGDFAAAAGGFAAILLDEPGFLDAPQLLVKARDGLRSAALAAVESGNRLDAAGDWTSAMRKYEQAREIDKGVPGLEDAFKRVREKMRAAGFEAMKRARTLDAAGKIPDAMHEYEKAAQWLPVDDPNRDIARARADQLKAKGK